VQTLAVGVCGTDLEIANGEYGWAPPGRERLVLGHESLGRVLEAPAASGLQAGDLVVAIVRQPDPEPCVRCAAGDEPARDRRLRRASRDRLDLGAERTRQNRAADLLGRRVASTGSEFLCRNGGDPLCLDDD
jgi:threonine dehydrogenase-like Zn-dependent dehydrogenase